MRSLKEIQAARLALVEIVTKDCIKKCVLNIDLGRWCEMCETAHSQEVILAWVINHKSLFDTSIDEAVKEREEKDGL